MSTKKPSGDFTPRLLLKVVLTGEDDDFVDLQATLEPEVQTRAMLDAVYETVLEAFSRAYMILDDLESHVDEGWN